MTPYYSDRNGQIVIFNARWEEVWAHLRSSSGLKHEDVALLWADPPYGIGVNTKRRAPRTGGVRGRDWATVAGDDRPFDPASLLAFPHSVLWGANHYASRLPDSDAWWLWDKRDGVTPERDQSDGEAAWTRGVDAGLRIFRHVWDGFIRASEMGPALHPTQKPVALATWGFQRATLKPGDLVFSSHMGLRFIGCEIVEEYCKAAVNRLAQLPLFTS
jgi:hypothetical protein